MSINISITFMHISWFILVSKSTSFTFFIWIFAYIHTFFHLQIMCSCWLAICLYSIRRASCERKLHHSRVAPSEPIWAEFISALGNIYPQLIRAATPVLSVAAIIYRHILLGENSFDLIHTRTWEKSGSIFSRRDIICTVYCWEKCKKL